MKDITRVIIYTCLLLIMLVAGGCSGTSEPDNTFVRLLALLPAAAKEDRIITIIDYELFREVNGISVFNEDGERVNREEYLERMEAVEEAGSLFGWGVSRLGSYWAGGGDYIYRSPLQDESVGYEITDIDAEINNIYVLSGPNSIIVGGIRQDPPFMIAAVGDLNAQATEISLKYRDEWPSWAVDNHTSENYQGITIHSWGDGLETHIHDRFSPPHLDNFGRALPLAVSDGLLFIGSYVDYIKSMIDVRRDETRSLDEIPEYVLAAEAMYNLGAIGAQIMDEAHTRDILMLSHPSTGPQISGFLTVAMGPGRDEVGDYMALVLVYENTTDAEKGVSLIKDKIEAYDTLCDMSNHREDVCIYDTEIYTEGRVLHAKLYTENDILWGYWFFNPWVIVLMEEYPYRR
jgi:hypothetical protein